LTTSQEKLLVAWVKENTDLIVNLVPEMYQRAEATVKEATRMGLSQRDLTKRIREDLRVPKARANLIARDQTLKVNSQLAEAAHKEAGISKFMWVTSADERVREDHQMLNGEIFDYDNPPAIGLPGTDFQCRCIAYPVIEGVNF
jgi:SPP1 gp7 family putative phage head morphogenesis protein